LVTTTLFLLLLAHFVCDHPLQTDFVARHKCPKATLGAVPWYYVMLGHCATHAAAVYLVTWRPILAALELVTHFAIDWAKCEGRFGIHTDQLIHVGGKVVWVGLLAITT